MPLFYFDVYDGVSGPDRVGKDCRDREAAAQEAARRAEALLASEGDWFRTGQEWQIGVVDSAGVVVANLSFSSVMDVRPSTHGLPDAHPKGGVPFMVAACLAALDLLRYVLEQVVT